jgi:23S rRNA pseudouridine2605 synthase
MKQKKSEGKKTFDRNNKPGQKPSFAPKKQKSGYSDYRNKRKKEDEGSEEQSDYKKTRKVFKDDFEGDNRSKSKPENYSRPYKKKEYTKSKSGSRTTSENKSSAEGIRLNKYISNAGICSRREADDLIKSGVVSVNGKVITEMGFRVKPTDIINYGGQTLKKEKMVYLILNKPKDYITTADDPQKRKTVLELIHGACRERIYPVGRLDRATTGLLLFTNDGELTKKLTHPRYGVRKIYHVELDKALKFGDLKQIAEGVELEDGEIKPDEITYVGDGSNKKEIGIELHSGKNRVVRRIFESLGYNVRKLDRVMFGPLTKKDLPRGRWRFLTEAEVGMLKMVSNKAE